jgi:D-alanyl-D-alanine carboxypeptidase-like protein
MLLYGAYPNIRPELREELVKEANNPAEQPNQSDDESISSDLTQIMRSGAEADSTTNNKAMAASNSERDLTVLSAEEKPLETSDTSGASENGLDNRVAIGYHSQPATNLQRQSDLKLTDAPTDERLDSFGRRPYRFDKKTEALISQLHPEVQPLVREHLIRIMDADPGVEVRLFETYRSYDESNKYRAQGVYPAAKGGESRHNFRVAYDLAFFDPKTGKQIKDGNDIAVRMAGRIGKEVGLTWGGDFTGKQFDPSHFELNRGINIRTMRERYETGKDVFTGK